MKAWWEKLAVREQILIAIAGALLILLLLDSLLWSPLGTNVKRLRQVSQQQSADLQWMQQAASELAARSASAPGSRKATGESLLSLIDRTLKETSLAGGLKRLQPEQGKVQLNFERVSFDDFIRWLDTTHRDYVISIDQITVEKQDASGLVNIRLGLAG